MNFLEILFNEIKYKKINKDTIDKFEKYLYDQLIWFNGDIKEIEYLGLSYEQLKAFISFIRNKITNDMINELVQMQQEFYNERDKQFYIDKDLKDVSYNLISMCVELKDAMQNNRIPYLPKHIDI